MICSWKTILAWLAEGWLRKDDYLSYFLKCNCVSLFEQYKMYNSAKHIFDCNIKTTKQVARSYVKLHLGTAVFKAKSFSQNANMLTQWHDKLGFVNNLSDCNSCLNILLKSKNVNLPAICLFFCVILALNLTFSLLIEKMYSVCNADTHCGVYAGLSLTTPKHST